MPPPHYLTMGGGEYSSICQNHGGNSDLVPPHDGGGRLEKKNPSPPIMGGGRFGQMGGSKKRHIFGCSPPMMGGEQPKKSGFLAENGVLGKLRHFFPHHGGGGQNFAPPILPHIFFSCLHFTKSYRTFFFRFAFAKTLPHIFLKCPSHHGGGEHHLCINSIFKRSITNQITVAHYVRIEFHQS